MASSPLMSPAAKAILTCAHTEAQKRGHVKVGSEHVLHAILTANQRDKPPRVVALFQPKWIADGLTLLETKKVFRPVAQQDPNSNLDYTVSMGEALQMATEIGSGPIRDGDTTIPTGVLATEFLLAAIMMHGVNVAAEVLGRASHGGINSWTILELCNVNPAEIHVARKVVSELEPFSFSNSDSKSTPSSSKAKTSSFKLGDILPDISSASFPKSPTEESNWLIPGTLVIGAHPDTTDAIQLSHAGVTTFVSLIGEYGIKTYRTRKYPSKITQATHFIHFGITDFDVPNSDELEMLVLELKRRVVEGECVYIHCRGGHGRTGTVVIPLLCALFNLENKEATTFVNKCTTTKRPYDVELIRMGYHIEMPETKNQIGLTNVVNKRVRMNSRRHR